MAEITTNDNVYTTHFTPREFQIELYEISKRGNVIFFLSDSNAKVFLTIQWIKEAQLNAKAAVLFADSAHTDQMTASIENAANRHCGNVDDANYPVVVSTYRKFNALLNSKYNLDEFSLIVVNDCQVATNDVDFQNIMRLYKNSKVIILGLATSLLDANCTVPMLETALTNMESTFRSKIEAASDIACILRYSNKPVELVIEYSKFINTDDLTISVKSFIKDAIEFLEDHRFDPFDIYDDDELMDEIKSMQYPQNEPLNLIGEFLHVLNTLGLWCANQAAAVLLKRIEKLKIQTRYDRHFLLLCMMTTVFVKIRCFLSDILEVQTAVESVQEYSSPKILRLIEFFRQVKPPGSDDNKKCDNSTKESVKIDSNRDDLSTNKCEEKSIDSNGGSNVVNNCTDPVEPPKPKPEMPTFSFRRRHPNQNHSDRPPRKPFNPDDLCGIIFVENRLVAPVLYQLFRLLNTHDPQFVNIYVQFLVDKSDNLDAKDIVKEHRNQENALKKFRLHEANLLIATSFLQNGIDIPKCNVIIHFDAIGGYKSYVYGKGRARIPGAYYVFFVEENRRLQLMRQLSGFNEFERLILSNCTNVEPPSEEAQEADEYFQDSTLYYQPQGSKDNPYVTLTSAISLVNKYCSRLPSDTFTRLTVIERFERTNDPCEIDFPNHINIKPAYRCYIRLPINSRLKSTIRGPVMPNRVLARRLTALKTCEILHKINELDNNLQPITKASFLTQDPDWDNFPLNEHDETLSRSDSEIRPGTTKRRQYYDKKIAGCFHNCRPTEASDLYLYAINMNLTCPLPDEQNTRGRRLYPPENYPQAFAILTRKPIPKISSFPIFTRSGEVNVKLQLEDENFRLNTQQLNMIQIFTLYLFTNVLKVQKYLMAFDPERSSHSYYIVPTIRTSTAENVHIDWKFLETIYTKKNLKPEVIPQVDRINFRFDPKQYEDAVVMPWYRNRDQPQHFYVAEICNYLTPKSSFPGENYNTFEEYYKQKYDMQIQNFNQPLLDVDHTSARLNFLTPRYVNRKGVALPTSSEATKRAKRENLEQKQILVPELCTIHPFPSSLWRKAVCLPCILYRINSLLLADEIRVRVAEDIGLGCLELPSVFEWSNLNYGWSLSAVLKRSLCSKRLKLEEEKNEEKDGKEVGNVESMENAETNENIEPELPPKVVAEPREEIKPEEIGPKDDETNDKDIPADPDLNETNDSNDSNEIEIGIWCNDMAKECLTDLSNEYLQNNLIRYGSPTALSEASDCSDDFSYYSDDTDTDETSGGIRIEFKGDTAEAIDDEEKEPVPDITEDKELDNKEWKFAEEETNDSECMNVKAYEENLIRERRIFGKETNIDLSLFKKNGKRQRTLKDLVSIESFNFNAIVTYDQCDYNPPKGHINMTDDTIPHWYDKSSENYLTENPGPSPSILLQALTMSNANDGINLERLETVGDSFLKHAITCYLYCVYEDIHEGKLSHLRSKQVSNLNLYRLGRKQGFGELMVGTKFEAHDNWLPPCFYVCQEDEFYEYEEEDEEDEGIANGVTNPIGYITHYYTTNEMNDIGMKMLLDASNKANGNFFLDACIPYNLLTQQSIPDKSIADSVEALIGAYLIDCGPRGALLFMSWLGIRVLPVIEKTWIDDPVKDTENNLVNSPGCLSINDLTGNSINTTQPLSTRLIGSTKPILKDGVWKQTIYSEHNKPKSPLLFNVPNAPKELSSMCEAIQYEKFEREIGYKFGDTAYMLQAFTHASYYPNQLTDCYQRLEFLGDAVLDYLITRHLYEDVRLHSPGALTDLRSALVNNTIFATLAVKFNFHKHLLHLSPGLQNVIDRFVRFQKLNNYRVTEEYFLIEDPENEEVEDIEVPKVLGDIFESVAGAIYLDSGMDLNAVWNVYYKMMCHEIELFSVHVPKSPIRELLELEPETARFGRPEKLADGRRVRVTVEIFGKGTFKGIGRNYRIAKCTAAKCALRQLKRQGLLCRRK